MAGFCEVVCVKYCVFTFPLVITAVQTHGAASSALRSIHAPTRNEAGTYIRASVASDLDTLRTPSTPKHQVMMMDIFLLGGWHARVHFIFALALVPCLILSTRLFVVALLGSMLNLIALCPLGFSWSPCLFPVFFVARVLLRLTEFNLTALCWPYLFLVYLAFPPCLVTTHRLFI